MVVCKFFLEGRCRFGVNCRNEHTQSRPTNSFQQPFQQPKQQYFQQQQHQQHQPHQRLGDQQEISLESLLYVVKEDATNSVQGGQWLLSCYAPLLRKFSKVQFNKNEENLPGLMDYSPEELRWEAISSNSSGQFQDYTSKLQQFAHNYHTIQRGLQNLDQATANFIVRYERGENVSSQGTVLGNSAVSFAAHTITPPSGPPQFSFSLPPNQPQPPTAVAPFRFQIPTQPLAVASPTNTPFSFQLPSQKPPTASFSFQLPNQTTQQPAEPPFSFQLPQQSQQLANNTTVPLQLNPLHTQSAQIIQPNSENNPHPFQLDLCALEQFKADKFSFGKIPRIPPPKELC